MKILLLNNFSSYPLSLSASPYPIFLIKNGSTMIKFFLLFLMVFSMFSNGQSNYKSVRIATFNVSMDATNYVEQDQSPLGDELSSNLGNGEHKQIKNIAEIIQQLKPDIVLLNEFDYSNKSVTDVQNFIKHYLKVSQNNQKPIDYPYFYIAPVNTGVDSGLDLDKDGIASGTKGDAFGFGLFLTSDQSFSWIRLVLCICA